MRGYKSLLNYAIMSDEALKIWGEAGVILFYCFASRDVSFNGILYHCVEAVYSSADDSDGCCI